MGELACNIVSYRPDPDMLAAKFRYWHVETLLKQADALIDRCLKYHNEYCYLDYAWNEFHTELETQEKKLGLDKPIKAEVEAEGEISAAEDQETPSDEAQASLEESEEVQAEPVDVDQAKDELAWPTAELSGPKSSLEIRAEAFHRKKELAAPGGPFALYEQRDLALKRLCRDYEEAINRACVAEEGLKKLYAYDELSSPLTYEAETLGTSITSLSIWIRNSLEWLVGYQEREQAFTQVVSVRSLLNRNAWAILRHSRDSYSTKLQVPADLFRGYDNCRLQGIGASLIGESGTVPWSIILRLPDEAIYERSGQNVEVDQSNRASCLLGRVENRRSARPLEICGVSSLFNASPMGRPNPAGLWSLEIFKPVGATSESFSHLEDVVIEIYAVGKPK